MALEDYAEPEVAVTAAVAAAVFSPRARKTIRKGLVYGLAGVLKAGDIVTSFAKSVGEGAQHVTREAEAVKEEAPKPAAKPKTTKSAKETGG